MRRVFVALVFITSLAYQTGAVPVPIYSEDVIWTNFVNTSARGNTLIKNSVTTTGGAASFQSIPSGDGFVEFTGSEEASNRAVGFRHRDDRPPLGDNHPSLRVYGARRGGFA